MSDRRRIPEAVADEVVRLHGHGLKIAAIDRRLNVSQSTVSRVLVRRGLITTRRYARVTPGMVAEMVGLYTAGTPIRAVSAKLDVSYGAVRVHLDRAGVKFRPRGGAR